MTVNQSIGHIKKCQICSAENLETIIYLGHMPPVHGHLTREKLNEAEITFPLNLCRCPNCFLVQLDYIVDPKILFPPDYPYLTGLTNMLVNNFNNLAEKLSTEYDLKPNDLVVDIGSNDGTLLKAFKIKGYNVLGIEPTDAAKIANQNGIQTIQEYFSHAGVKKIITRYGKARVITATNVFAHINQLHDLMAGINELLSDDGIFVSESQYLLDIIEKLEFDTIYHEHLRYYSLKPLEKLLSLYNMKIIDAQRISAAGGSIRIIAAKGPAQEKEGVKKIREIENDAEIYSQSRLENFAKQIIKAKQNLLALLLDLKRKNFQIVGLGAPARSNTLLGFSKIDTSLLDYACEKKGSPKIGLFTPGTHLSIFDEEKVFSERPEYALLLSWHIGDELMKIFRSKGYQGKFIVPLPEPKIIN